MKWYKHDANAHADAKLERLRLRYGMEGYGFYFYCLELIASNVEKHNLTFELEHDAELLAARTGIHTDQINEMMVYISELGLFENNRGVITCLKMATRTDEYTQKLIKAAGNIPIVSGECRESVGTNSENVRSIRREEKRREETRPAKAKKFKPPTIEQVEAYCSERKNGVSPSKFMNHYETAGWLRGKTKIKDWKACVRTWEGNQTNTDVERAYE